MSTKHIHLKRKPVHGWFWNKQCMIDQIIEYWLIVGSNHSMPHLFPAEFLPHHFSRWGRLLQTRWHPKHRSKLRERSASPRSTSIGMAWVSRLSDAMNGAAFDMFPTKPSWKSGPVNISFNTMRSTYKCDWLSLLLLKHHDLNFFRKDSCFGVA